MHLIVKLFPEIMIKSESVRKRFTKVLAGNIRTILKKTLPEDSKLVVTKYWDFIEVYIGDESLKEEAISELINIPGIHHILDIEEIEFSSIEDLYEKVKPFVIDTIENKTFSVRVKRKGIHDFSSLDVEKYIGGGLNQSVASAKVKLKNPDVEVALEIENMLARFVKVRHEGLGGYPIGTQDGVISLISGGFDSAVASYMFARRGSKVHYLFFNLGGIEHEIGVRKMSHLIWNKYSKSHKVFFISIPFAAIVEEILLKVDNAYMGVILKRMMFRAASAVAKNLNIEAFVTGESLGQVSSQTLTNLSAIDKVTDTLVFRPLITHDKEQIIKIAREIGANSLAEQIPEFCGVISNNPTVKADLSKVEEEEAKFDFKIFDISLDNSEFIDIRKLETEVSVPKFEDVSDVLENDFVIDIRSPNEV
ncbi:MAG: tRNA uracil 4-sulfurtransferase ThiI, partial [Psittacicella sp.]